MRRTPTMSQHTTVTHVGLDVSKASISVALLRPGGHLDEERIANTPEDVRRLVRRWPEPSRVRDLLRGRPTVYDLYRHLSSLGIETTVIARIHRGGSVIDPLVVAQLVGHGRARAPLDDLTEREREILSLMAEGRSNQAICERLYLAPKTVEAHITSIFSSRGDCPLHLMYTL